MECIEVGSRYAWTEWLTQVCILCGFRIIHSSIPLLTTTGKSISFPFPHRYRFRSNHHQFENLSTPTILLNKNNFSSSNPLDLTLNISHTSFGLRKVDDFCEIILHPRICPRLRQPRLSTHPKVVTLNLSNRRWILE